VARELGLPHELVEALSAYYWQEVRRSLSALKHPRVHISNLGDFVIKPWKLQEKIEKLEHFEEYNRQRGLQQMTARFRTAETLYDLRHVKKMLEEEKQRQEFIQMHKKTAYESKTKCDQDLEEQGTDPGGD
jgi:hypothetical protein